MKSASFDCSLCDAKQHSYFKFCATHELEKLSEEKTANRYKKGQILFFEGNRPMGLYCIKQGSLKLYKTGIDGKEQIVRFAQAGDFLGYRALIADEAFSVTAEALEEVVSCFIPKALFFCLLEENTEISRALFKTLCQELGVAHERLTNMAQKNVRERMAETLLILLDSFRTNKPHEAVIPVQLPREDIANLAGTSTETAIRLLSEFKETGLIEFKGKQIKVTDKAGLAKVARS